MEERRNDSEYPGGLFYFKDKNYGEKVNLSYKTSFKNIPIMAIENETIWSFSHRSVWISFMIIFFNILIILVI